MKRTSWTWWRRAVCSVLVPLAGAALAEESPRGLEGGEKVDVTLNLLFTPASGATVRTVGMGPFPLGVGESLGSAISSPFGFGASLGTCTMETGTHEIAALLARHTHAWTADATVLEASQDGLLLDAWWRRYVRGSDGRPREVAAEALPRVRMREGDRVLLDYVASTADERACARNFALELVAGVREDPVLASRQIAYDLWLVHESRDGTRTSSRSQLTGRQGEQLDFAFPDETLSAPSTNGEVLRATVTGRVRGRIRSGGAVEVWLSTRRALSFVAADGSSDGGVSDGGEKTVRVKPDETIRLDLPPPDAGPVRRDPRVPRMVKDLAGHTFALIVTAKAL